MGNIITTVSDTFGMEAIGEHSIKGIIQKAEEYINVLSQLPENPAPEKKGGYLTLMDWLEGIILLVIPVGIIPQEKIGKYIYLSQEKLMRLYEHRTENHVSSWQSRDVNLLRYGGAVKGLPLCVSFSGLAEKCDEALSLVLAIDLMGANLKGQYADTIISVSDNKIYEALVTEVERRKNKK